MIDRNRYESLADALASVDDLEAVKHALIREAIIREVMRESGETREVVTEMIDAMDSMGQEAVLGLTEGEPTTLADAVHRYVDELEKRDELQPRDRIVDELTCLVRYPYPGQDAPGGEAAWRSRLAQEVYQHADCIEREPETRSLGVALASVVRHVGDQIGRMP